MLQHLAGNKEPDENDAAQWLSYYLGKKHDRPFTAASEAFGILLVQCLDPASSLAMWSDANVNYNKRIVKKHLQHHFGKQIFILETMFSEDSDHYSVLMFYNEYKCYKNVDETHKPQRCSYWRRDPSNVVLKELSRMLDYLDPISINSRFNSLLTSGSCTLIAGADQGQGAWRSCIKIRIYGGNEVRECLRDSDNFDVKSSY